MSLFCKANNGFLGYIFSSRCLFFKDKCTIFSFLRIVRDTRWHESWPIADIRMILFESWFLSKCHDSCHLSSVGICKIRIISKEELLVNLGNKSTNYSLFVYICMVYTTKCICTSSIQKDDSKVNSVSKTILCICTRHLIMI